MPVYKKEFTWDPQSGQPFRTGGRVSNFLRGLREIVPMTFMGLTNLLHMPRIFRHYRQYKRSPQPSRIDAAAIGLALTPGSADMDQLRQTWHESGAGSTLIRVLTWDPEAPARARDCIQSLGISREQAVIAMIQDRACIADPAVWTARLGEALKILKPCAAAFQLGQAPNRRKWGFNNPREYIEICRRSLALKPADVSYIGPSAIDFELVFTDGILSRMPAGCLDIFNSLLYVDRRGAPENAQSFSFETMNKVRITKAVADTNGLGDLPFWISEVNWPIENTGKYSPTGRALRISEGLQADYLARYYLLAFATGIPERIIWWELAAHGYGLIDNLEASFRKRPGFEAFRTIASLLPGRTNTGFSIREGLYAAAFQGETDTLIAVWRPEGPPSLAAIAGTPSRMLNISGEELDSGDDIVIFGSPTYLFFDGKASIEETLPL